MSTATQHDLTGEDYERAARFLPWKVADLLFDGHVDPHWIGGTERFWYRIRKPSGTMFMLVDPERDLQEPVFDHARLAAALSQAGGTAYDSTNLPFTEIELVDGGQAVRFTADMATWECNLETYGCKQVEKKEAAAEHELASPDGKWIAFTREYNLFVRDRETGEERQLTDDGEQWYGYAATLDANHARVADTLFDRKHPPVALWSPDSRRLVTYRLDERAIPEMYVLQTALPEGTYRPILHPFRQPQPGDEHVVMAELILLDVVDATVIRVDYEPLPCSFRTVFETFRIWWDKDSTQLYFIHEERGHRRMHLVTADAGTGKARRLHSESGKTVIDLVPTYVLMSHNVRILGDGSELIWYSTRDGWGHLYLYDGTSDELKNQITSGPWVVHQIVHVDEEGRWVYFLAGGREEERDPYMTDLYGLIMRPSTFDPAKRYPVIDSIYPGPQITKTSKRFAGNSDQFGIGRQFFWQDQALAELGFIVVTIDGQGTPFRSKAFMDVAAGERFGEAGGLADHVAGLRQLGARDPSLDLSRVGIYGHSGGGYASARAILQFPEFYKVAVSSAGNHDQQGYAASWGERYIGLPEGDNYRDQANYHLAKNLRGKLLLVYGQLDDNVPPALTLQLVDALIQANKDFDLLVLPHHDHLFVDFREGREKYELGPGLYTDPYFVRRRWDYFVRHLLGAEPPAGFAIDRE